MRLVEGHGGVPIAVSVEGAPIGATGAGPPVLFVHGFAHDRSVWRGVFERLPSEISRLRMDLRGHGGSGWSVEGHYAIDDHAADVVRVLDALEIDRASLVAHSLGGHAATVATAMHPDRIATLTLVDTGPSLSLTGMMQIATGVSGMLRSYADVRAYRAVLDLTYPLAEASALDHFAECNLVRRRDGRLEPRLDPALLFDPLDARLLDATEARLWRALESVRCPTLVVRGAASAMLPADVALRMVERALPGARLHTVAQAGHSVMLDAADELAREIEAHLDAAEVRRPDPDRHARPIPSAGLAQRGSSAP